MFAEPQVLRRVSAVAALGYVVLFILGSFPTGTGEHFFRGLPPGDVVTWATAHPAAIDVAVPATLLDDWLFLVFAFTLLALSGIRSLLALFAVAGLIVADAIFAVILGLQYAVPRLAGLPDGGSAARAAVVIQYNLQFSVHAIPLAIGIAAFGLALTRGTVVPRFLGGVATVLGVMVGLSWPLRAAIPALLPFETAASIGVLLWTLVTGLVLLKRAPKAELSDGRRTSRPVRRVLSTGALRPPDGRSSI